MAKAPAAIERRYGGNAAREWALALRHVDLADGFLLLILAVPDRDGADLCLAELQRHLGTDHRVARIAPDSPAALRRLANAILDAAGGDGFSALWVSAAISPAAPNRDEWQAAWLYALGGLNQSRNQLREHLSCPLILVLTPWALPLFRDMAPDLWSVRSAVIQIEPEKGEREEREEPRRPEPRPAAVDSAPDPDLALAEAQRVRGKAGAEASLAALLDRAGLGLSARGDHAAAEACFDEAAHLHLALGRTIDAARSRHNQARSYLDRRKYVEAEDLFRQALALAEEGGGTPISRGITLHELARCVRGQGRAAEAEALFRQALALAEEGGDTPISRGITLHELARCVLDLGRAAEAEALFRQALALGEEGGAAPDSLAPTLEGLADALTAQAEEARQRAQASRDQAPPTGLP